ncbi:MAG: glycosyltransferase family 2 protein [Pseudomonadales bacterium]
MSYEIMEIDIAHPPETLQLSEEAMGIAILLRQCGNPVGFWMETLASNPALGAEILARKLRNRIAQGNFGINARPKDHGESKHYQAPSLSIAICTRDRPQLAIACVRSVSNQFSSAAVGGSFREIIVVDNAPSDDRTRCALEAFPDVHYVHEPKAGLNFARNRAIAVARGDLIAYVDDDVVIDSGWLRGLLNAVSDNPDAGAFTGQILPLELVTEAQILFELRGGFRRGFARVRYDSNWRGGVLYPCRAGMFGNGANMAFRRDVLERLGGFDEALDTGPELPGGGDMDIFYRVVRAGYPLVYDPQYLVFHRHRRDMTGLRTQYQDSWGKAAMAYAEKCLRTDSGNRPKIILFIFWWFLHELWQIQKSIRGRHAIPATILLSELKGGIAGIFGEYGRSRERVQRIRQKHA